MRRFVCLLMLLMLFVPARAEDLTLPAATSKEEVERFLLMPKKYALAGVERGYLRYISQNEKQDPNFRATYWLGGPVGTKLDLTLKKLNGKTFANHAGTLCSRAAYSMALSYLGVDITPGEMSRIMNARGLAEPYDMFSDMLGVERNNHRRGEFTNAFDDFMDLYLTDPDYSPVYLYLQRPNGTYHALLVVAEIPEESRFLVVDANALRTGGKLYRVYFISLNPGRSKVVNSTFKDRLKDSKVLQVYQWRLADAEN